MRIIKKIHEERKFYDEKVFSDYLQEFRLAKRKDIARILENQGDRFREAQRLGVRAEYVCSTDFIQVFGVRLLINIQTTLVTYARSFEDKRRISLAVKNPTSEDYRRSGDLD